MQPFNHFELGKPSKIYDYHDETGKVLFHVYRFDLQNGEKTFRQCKPGGTTWNVNGVRLVPNNLPEVIKSTQVIIVEGEKDCENLQALGYVATTNPMGAGKWRDEYSNLLRGKDIILIPDNDAPGRDHMRKVAASLQGKAGSIKRIDLPGLPEKGDVSDWIKTFGDDDPDAAGERLALMIEGAKPFKGNEIESTEAKIQPLTPDQTSVLEFIEKVPPETSYIFKDTLPRGVVGGIVGMGGVSKSFFMLTLGIGAATGQTVLKHFEPVSPFKVLAFFAEDSQEELHRRTHFTVEALFPDIDGENRNLLIQNFHAKSLLGKIGPLMKLEHGNPSRSEWFYWLKETIQAHEGLEVLILDPKSRLYGLEENSNDHNTAWIACLEELSREFGLTILFSHHVSKVSAGALSQTSARGGSALVDACRWLGNLKTMDEVNAKKFEITNPKQFVEFDISKNNYAPALPRTFYFKRGKNGVLQSVNLEFSRIKTIADELCVQLNEMGSALTRRELCKCSAGKEIRETLKDRFSKCTHNDLEDAVKYALRDGMISEVSISTSTKSRAILRVERLPDESGQSGLSKI